MTLPPSPEDGFLGATDPCAGRPECARQAPLLYMAAARLTIR
jgi:hypothetical protein